MDKISPKILGPFLILVGLLPLLVYAARIRHLLSPKADIATSAPTSNPFGVMTWGDTNHTKMQIANDLGARYYRPLSVFLDSWAGSCPECDAATIAGLKLVLTVGNSDSGNPPANLTLYKNKLTEVMNMYSPEVLVIENEENSDLFYTGTPQQYLAQLKAGCEVAHSKNTQCANGGLVSKLVVVLVSQSYLPDANKADDYLKRALTPDDYAALVPWISSPQGQEQISRGQDLLAGYKTSGADFVNFHWYQANAETLPEAVTYLNTASQGLPVFTNEAGQQGNTDAGQVTSFMQKTLDLNLPYALWFSLDINRPGGAMALTDKNGPLRDNGRAYQQFINDHFRPTPTPSPSPTPLPPRLITSIPAEDGDILESGENKNTGGTINSTHKTLKIGDNATDKQYIGILSFSTSVLPDTCVITRAEVNIRRKSITGTDPFTTHGQLVLDIKKGKFGTSSLETTDFEATATHTRAATFTRPSDDGSHALAVLPPSVYPSLNLTGKTQMRVYFKKDDDNNNLADYVSFYSGDSTSQPFLAVTCN